MTENSNARTRQLDRAHVFHSWSAQGALDPMVIAGGSGVDVGGEYTPIDVTLTEGGQ